jgi:hypothetical protein
MIQKFVSMFFGRLSGAVNFNKYTNVFIVPVFDDEEKRLNDI